MWTPLTPHPDSVPLAVTALAARAVRGRSGVLELHYRLTGDMARVRLPPPACPAFTDGLWRGTCFEAFVRAPADQPYLELNLAPSTEWAAYRFDGYRQGMRPAEGLGAPAIEVRRAPDVLELQARLELGGAGWPGEAGWRLGLSAVVQEADGRTSYWALMHPPGKPDFHHADCFALDLPAPDLP